MNNEETLEEEKISFWAQLKEDFYVPKNNDPALDNNLELFFNYPGVWAIINYRFANKLYYKGWKKLSRVISGISSFLTKTDIHPACTIGRRVFIDHAIGVVIGANAVVRGHFPDYCVIVGVPAKIVKRYDALSGIWKKTNSKGEFLDEI